MSRSFNLTDNIARGTVQNIVYSGIDTANKNLRKVAFNTNDDKQEVIAANVAVNDYPNLESSNPARGIISPETEASDIKLDFMLVDTNDATNWLQLGSAWTMNLNRTKRIQQTTINGQIGTVKEWISDGDVVINLKIMVLPESDIYPEGRLKEVMNFLSMNRPLIVVNNVLNNLNITQVVVSSWSHIPETWSNRQTINVDLVQDDTYLIEEQILK